MVVELCVHKIFTKYFTKKFLFSVDTDFNKYELLREVLCLFGGIYFQYNWVGN